MSKTPDYQKKALKKYLNKFYEFKVRIPLDEKDALVKHASKTGESLSSFVKRAIKETMKNDKKKKWLDKGERNE